MNKSMDELSILEGMTPGRLKPEEEKYLHDPDGIDVIPLRGLVFYPKRRYQFDVGRPGSLAAVAHATNTSRLIYLVAQRDPDVEDPEFHELYEVGVLARINLSVDMGDGYRVGVETICRATAESYRETETGFKVMIARHDDTLLASTMDSKTKLKCANDWFKEFLVATNSRVVMSTAKLQETTDVGFVTDYIADHIPITMETKQAILKEFDEESRLEKLLPLLYGELQLIRYQRDIETKVKRKISKDQKEFYLREQIKVIQSELGEDKEQQNEVEEMRNKLKEIDLPPVYKTKVRREIDRYAKMSSTSAESAVIRNYVNWILDLPWKITSVDQDDLKRAEEILNEDHYGLDKVKERILEYLAVKKLSNKMNAQIICLVGPPGVGKTSIGRSIARALDRKFARLSLGGLNDESEIRGHRRTYIGAIPGRIINSIKDAGTKNPVILLDEIDKLSHDFRGDPASALLEVLDPEQNKEFTDNYLEMPFDLSQVMFITTANTLSTIPRPLLDRMEVIEISGYTEDEKKHIAVKYLVPKKMAEHGLKKGDFTITDSAVLEIVRSYTRESGVRNLERKIAELCRKAAVRLARDGVASVKVTERTLSKYLGKKIHRFDLVSKEDQVGIATGLAWTSVGGETLSIEVNVQEGGSGKLRITGQIGDVMRESAEAALSYIRTVPKEYGIDEESFKTKDIHVHIPEGAIPKDGPSAGITMATAILSALSGIKVSRYVAMTGEVTLRGRVLAIGGLKEKALAAMRAGIKTVLYPAENEGDFAELPEILKENMEFVAVKNMKQVLKHALVRV